MIVAGFGFREGATVQSLTDAFERAGGQADRFATLADKSEHPAFRAFATARCVTSLTPETLQCLQTITQSSHSQKARATGSVAEACALAAAGPDARLVGPRVISADRMATCALAETPSTGDIP